MKLILTAAVDKLGAAGEVVEVKDGYGRNYLLPTGKAIRWTRGADKQIEGIKRARDAREIRGLDHANEVKAKLDEINVQVPVRASAEGRLFGAVTAADVAKAVKAAGGPAVDKRSIQIAKPIKTVGSHTVGIKLHEAVTAHIQVATVAGN